ncbi:MAG: putative addiction module antidote protein [Candidatus Accumulibacter sp.]|jgi:probable addiction module antidote protein|nr:putative addiction module antidote protein [Accumulibacter sp.]
MTIKTLPFDIVAELDNEEDIQEFFRQVMEDGSAEEIAEALGIVARARGMAQLAKDAGLERESLNQALAPGAKPRFETVLKVTRALGLKMTVAHV